MAGASNTEEDIKLKVILPFLSNLGFSSDELSFEKSFFLKLGTYSVRVDSGESITVAKPRLDILIKVAGVNLFIFEVKSDSVTLDDDDRDQAVSYARLVHPIAPFVILTNGVQFEIFNSITKDEVSQRTDFRGYNLQSDLSDIYDEAFTYFIGYSTDNLRMFCEKQVESSTRPLVGSVADKSRKFIPEFYVNRQDLFKAFEQYLHSQQNIFAIVGESGSGKTCEMCGLAFSLQERYPVLFYRGIDFIGSIIQSIASDFNWEFSSTLDEIGVIKKISRVVKGTALIFIDGIDEWTYPFKVEDLNNFARRISSYNVKLVVSCKIGSWERFVLKGGIPTHLSELAYSFNKKNYYHLSKITEKEFFLIIDKYRVFYNFYGGFEHDVLEQCKRSLFTLRMFFETITKHPNSKISFLNDKFYNIYLKSILEKFDFSIEM